MNWLKNLWKKLMKIIKKDNSNQIDENFLVDQTKLEDNIESSDISEPRDYY